MKQIRIGLLSKKRGNYRLQERLVGANVVEDTTDFEVTHHHDSLINAGFEVQLIHWGPYFIRDVQDADLDIIFNVSSLVEAAILEDLEIPFVGSGTNGIALARSKPLAKRIWLQEGIPTSRFAVLRSMSDCEAFIKNPSVPFPLFAKPVAGRGSAGISPESKIKNGKQLTEQAKHLLETIRQPVLIEQFLVGREITIGLVGNGKSLRTLLPMEVKFNGENKFLTFNSKEADCEEFICPADLTMLEKNKLGEYSRAAFRALGLRDYGRIDTKLTVDGFQLLEANSFAGLTTTPPEKPHSYVGVMARKEGLDGSDLLREIVEAALERIKNEEPNVKSAY